MHLPEIDKYAHLKSIFHSWEPRAKLVSFLFLIITISLLHNLISACAGLVLAVVLVFLSGIPFRFVFKSLTWLFLFVLLFFVIMPLTVPGRILFKVGFITCSQEGFNIALLIALRAISIGLLVFPMIGTMEFHKTLKALSRLKIPNRLIQMIMFTYRYLFVFIEEYRRMTIATQARLFKRRTNLSTLRITGNLISMLFIRGFERTQCIYDAMVSRGYKGNLEIIDESKLCCKDFLKSSLIIMAALLLNFSKFVF